MDAVIGMEGAGPANGTPRQFGYLMASDSCLAMENMFIAAASLGIMSGWDHATVMELFDHTPELKAELIPEGYTVYAAAFFGYPGPAVKDRGERKGTVAYV